MPIVKMEQIKKVYNKKTPFPIVAVNGIDMKIEKGELIAITGTSGSGKSTLLHILSGIDLDFEGLYEFCSMDVKKTTGAKLASLRNTEIGVVLQNFGLINELSVYENIAIPFYLSNKKCTKKEIAIRVEKLLKDVGLSDKIKSKVCQLSGGQKQRVAIARALVHNPKLILADEPTGALDYKTTEEIMNLFVELHSKGHTIVIVTHDLNIAKRCDRIISLSDGEIV